MYVYVKLSLTESFGFFTKWNLFGFFIYLTDRGDQR